jgi:hypothetical protein
MLFVGARTPTGENQDHPYTFMTREADGAPLEIVIRDVHGKQVGTEMLDYEIVVTGVIWGIEWI